MSRSRFGAWVDIGLLPFDVVCHSPQERLATAWRVENNDLMGSGRGQESASNPLANAGKPRPSYASPTALETNGIACEVTRGQAVETGT
jgi:hypothetical protein